MIRSEIQHSIQSAVRSAYGQIEIPEFSVAPPDNSEHGDYATNAALVLANVLKKPPMEIASAIAESFVIRHSSFVIKVAPPGFINLRISPETLHNELKEIFIKKNQYGRSKVKGQMSKVNLEFISANPTGPLTIGNGRGAFLGDALAKVLSLSGHKVTREYYINDARASTQIQELGKTILGKGEAYKGKYTDEIKMRLKRRFNKFQNLNMEDAGFAAAQEIQKDNKKFIEKILKIKFDVWYSEEKLYKNRLVKKTLEELVRRDVTYRKDNAVWFRASRFGDSEDRVVIRTGGAPTYFLPDVAYHAEKLTTRKFDKVIDILGADHHGTFPRVLAGLRALGLDANRVTGIFTQIVRLMRSGKEVKMSKRLGQFVTLEELVKEVGLDTARYFFLEKSPDTHMDFDLDLAKERSAKNPVYYIQYAHARIVSIFKKSNLGRFDSDLSESNFQLLCAPEELTLIKKLIQFPEVVEDTANDYQVHRLTRYAYELARSFHNFYEKHRVITEDTNLMRARLALVRATQIVLQLTLDLLGIQAPRGM